MPGSAPVGSISVNRCLREKTHEGNVVPEECLLHTVYLGFIFEVHHLFDERRYDAVPLLNEERDAERGLRCDEYLGRAGQKMTKITENNILFPRPTLLVAGIARFPRSLFARRR